MSKNASHNPLIAIIAAFYAVLCTASSVRNLAEYFREAGVHITLIPFYLTIGWAAFGIAYFLHPRAGHLGLIAMAVLTLIAIGGGNFGATIFHLIILILLLAPFRRAGRMSRPATN